MAKKEHNDLRKFLTAAYLMENAWAYWVVTPTKLGNKKWGAPVQTYDLVIDGIYLPILKPEDSYLPEFRPGPKKRIHKVMGISEATFKKMREWRLLESSSEKGNTIYRYKPDDKIFTPFYLIHSGRV